MIIELRLQSCFSLFSQARLSLRPQPCQLPSLSSPTRTPASPKTLASHLIPQNNQTQKSKKKKNIHGNKNWNQLRRGKQI